MAEIAYCPKHGLHGERTKCYKCKKPVEQVRMVPLLAIVPAWRALERVRDRWIGHAVTASLKARSLSELLILEQAEHESAFNVALNALEYYATGVVEVVHGARARRALTELRELDALPT